MVVMCVHDADTEMSAASLSVGVGANMDPEELQGLAHFLEHMLFMTTFYLGVPNGAMEEGLDRFSSFFTNPLFKKDGVDRELCAVDSEFKGLCNSDFWRLHQLSCKLKSGHPRCKFMVGNIESLQQGAETWSSPI
ncbi:metalloprotease [Coemansia sp. RSA 2673]|nr:metalloprotease [Coemansia sp. RSA 2673]